MSDYLVEWGQKPWFRNAVQTLGLPLPMPQTLERGKGAIEAHDLSGASALVGGAKKTALEKVLSDAGAAMAAPESSDKVSILVYDSRGSKSPEDLSGLYEFVHHNIRRIGASGRLIVVADDPATSANAMAAAAANACTGFVKSAAKEIGKRGATSNVIYAESGADHNVAGVLRFLASARSAFVDAQVFSVGKTTKPKTKVPFEQALAKKVALVTGAARGIGEVTARRLAAEGAKVILLDVPPAKDDLNKVAADIDGVPLLLDITAQDAPQKILDTAEKLGGLDIVINNAGITRDKTLANMKPDFWDLAIAVNLTAALRISEAFLAATNKGGRVVCLSSIAGIAGNFGQTNYGAAKSGLIGAVKSLAPEFAAKGATINAVAPGFIETQMTAAIPFVTREAGRRLSALGQGGLPVDVAELITFLASPAAAGINGQTIRVCGCNFLGA